MKKSKSITVQQAKKEEIDWINNQYKTIDFVASEYDNEWIAIARVDGQKAGLGRLVKIEGEHLELGGIYVLPSFRGLGIARKIVDTLCSKSQEFQAITWCLPFENLAHFYIKFGFAQPTDQEIPTKILQKLHWCNHESNYEQNVILLCK